MRPRPLSKKWFDALIIAVRCAPSWCQLKTGTLDEYRFYLSLYPPRIPLKKGDERSDLCTPGRSAGAGRTEA